VKSLAAMTMLDAQLAKTAYIAGDTFSMGDISVGAMAYRFRRLMPESKLENLERWFARIEQRPASTSTSRRSRSCKEEVRFGRFVGNHPARRNRRPALTNGSHSTLSTPLCSWLSAPRPNSNASCFLRNAKRAESPIPQRKAVAEILVEVVRVRGVMNLMMRRALDQVAEPAARRNPDMRVPKMQQRHAVGEQHHVNPEQRRPCLCKPSRCSAAP